MGTNHHGIINKKLAEEEEMRDNNCAYVNECTLVRNHTLEN